MEQVEIANPQRGEFTESCTGQARGEDEHPEALVNRVGKVVQFLDSKEAHLAALALWEFDSTTWGAGEQVGFDRSSERHREQPVGELHGGRCIPVTAEPGDPTLYIGWGDCPKLSRSEVGENERSQIGVISFPC